MLYLQNTYFCRAEDLLDVTEKESRLRTHIPFPKNVRLACQTYVKGDNVKVHRMVRDEKDIELSIKEYTLTDLEHTGQENESGLFF
jgi:adenylate cyclase